MSEALAKRETATDLEVRRMDVGEVSAYLKQRNYLVQLGGKDYVLTTGLVDAFHRIGGDELYSEDPVLFKCLEFGCEGAKATDVGFRVRSHAKIGVKHYSQIGDACPHNTTSVTAKARQRMAETRANGRTLRLATNAGYATTEEVEDSPKMANVTVEAPKPQSMPEPVAYVALQTATGVVVPPGQSATEYIAPPSKLPEEEAPAPKAKFSTAYDFCVGLYANAKDAKGLKKASSLAYIRKPEMSAEENAKLEAMANELKGTM